MTLVVCLEALDRIAIPAQCPRLNVFVLNSPLNKIEEVLVVERMEVKRGSVAALRARCEKVV
ncbi:hypothetical protein H257_07645 [Aphanomyces astaci]|uniref:Uncharacterized protein n=1 Tax=Aphanomyces astaci TaxID=112090 RepID=W4GGK2_APHAT|nr:hypothetical protein H257_07645 [Aphanomyces astaci]ETV78815.1 hypothetical protein H257_07645 [Aphanomyces astaci]|eukprot:XP_009831534.1 hypothetical protein H257_07645 [Aphanomyces astaci]